MVSTLFGMFSPIVSKRAISTKDGLRWHIRNHVHSGLAFVSAEVSRECMLLRVTL